jgi:hypothetical protein
MGQQTFTFRILITKFPDNYPQCGLYIQTYAPENVADKRLATHTENILNNNWLILLVVNLSILSVFQGYISTEGRAD